MVTTMIKHSKASYRDIINADIVIFSTALLENKNYQRLEPACYPDQPKTADWDPTR